MDYLISKALLPAIILSLAACSSKKPPEAEVISEEPVVVSNEQYNQPYEPAVEQINEPFEPAPAVEADMDQAAMEESSGIASPVEEIMINEPAAEVMTEEPVTEVPSNNISEIPADHFAVQLVASSTTENLTAFATRHDLSSDLTAQITVDGKIWHILLLGTYPTLAEAKEALAGINDKLTTSPWIRTIGSVQNISQ